MDTYPMKQTTYYGCCLCQQHHYEDTDPELFKRHIAHQSRHGVRKTQETFRDRTIRYGLEVPEHL